MAWSACASGLNKSVDRSRSLRHRATALKLRPLSRHDRTPGVISERATFENHTPMKPRDERRIRVLCVDDHRVMLDGLALLIGRQPDMEVIASTTSGEHAVELFDYHQPDITLMDLQLPTMSGLEAISEIRRSH